MYFNEKVGALPLWALMLAMLATMFIFSFAMEKVTQMRSEEEK